MQTKHNQNLLQYSHIDVLDQDTVDMLKNYAGDNPELVQDIVNSFAPEAEELLQNIQNELSNQAPDMENLRINLHSLAGIAGSVGASRLRQIAVDAENAIKAEDNALALELAMVTFDFYQEAKAHLAKF